MHPFHLTESATRKPVTKQIDTIFFCIIYLQFLQEERKMTVLKYIRLLFYITLVFHEIKCAKKLSAKLKMQLQKRSEYKGSYFFRFSLKKCNSCSHLFFLREFWSNFLKNFTAVCKIPTKVEKYYPQFIFDLVAFNFLCHKDGILQDFLKNSDSKSRWLPIIC